MSLLFSVSISINPCDAGKSYWCFSQATAAQCKYVCQQITILVIIFQLNQLFFRQSGCKKFKHPGPSQCKWGVNEWCASPANAQRCKVHENIFM